MRMSTEDNGGIYVKEYYFTPPRDNPQPRSEKGPGVCDFGGNSPQRFVTSFVCFRGTWQLRLPLSIQFTATVYEGDSSLSCFVSYRGAACTSDREPFSAPFNVCYIRYCL